MKKSILLFGSVAAAGLLAGCVERRVVYVREPAPPPPAVAVTPPPSPDPSAPMPAPPPDAMAAPETPPPGEVPPPMQTEVVTVAPGPAYAWVPGVWAWHGRWIWAGGHWVVGPHPRAIWVGGHWVRRGRRMFWVNGYWR
ncbi:MAG TPA: hypothetical protein VH597_14660 [Verrucomicrobiae bacterium]|nr:hypothetical protein [Verrucomicrobiae bacterium]